MTITELLLKNGADPNSENYWGNTPLSGAAVHSATAIARLLLEYGADPNAPGDYPKSDIEDQPLGPNPHNFIFVPTYLQTHALERWRLQCRRPLQWAISRGREELVRMLLDAGADPNTPDRFGRTALFSAVCSGQINTVRLLLALPGIDKYHADQWGLTPILESQRRQYDEIYMLLMSREVPDPEDKAGIEAQEGNKEQEHKDNEDDESISYSSPCMCYICLKKLDEKTDRMFQCRNLEFCEFCPPPEGERSFVQHVGIVGLMEKLGDSEDSDES